MTWLEQRRCHTLEWPSTCADDKMNIIWIWRNLSGYSHLYNCHLFWATTQNWRSVDWTQTSSCSGYLYLYNCHFWAETRNWRGAHAWIGRRHSGYSCLYNCHFWAATQNSTCVDSTFSLPHIRTYTIVIFDPRPVTYDNHSPLAFFSSLYTTGEPHDARRPEPRQRSVRPLSLRTLHPGSARKWHIRWALENTTSGERAKTTHPSNTQTPTLVSGSPSVGATVRPAVGSSRTSRSNASPPSGRSCCRARPARSVRCDRAGRSPWRRWWGLSGGPARTARRRRTTRWRQGWGCAPSSTSSSSPPSCRRASARSWRTDLWAETHTLEIHR